MRKATIALLVVATTVITAAAQQGAPDSESETGPAGPGFVYQGQDLPLYFVVDGFFTTLRSCYELDPERRVYAGILYREFGITTESEAGQALTRALLRVATTEDAMIGRSPTDSTEVDIRKRVLALKAIYREFLEEWRDSGEPTELLTDYFERAVRPSNALLSTDGPRPDIMAIAREFEEP